MNRRLTKLVTVPVPEERYGVAYDALVHFVQFVWEIDEIGVSVPFAFIAVQRGEKYVTPDIAFLAVLADWVFTEPRTVREAKVWASRSLRDAWPLLDADIVRLISTKQPRGRECMR